MTPENKAALKKANRAIEDEEERIDADLAKVQADHETLCAQKSPIDEKIRANEAKRDALTKTVHQLRQERVALRKTTAEEVAK